MTQPTRPLENLRGGFPHRPLTARRVAAQVDTPGCRRRTSLDLAEVDLDRLAALVLGEDRARQSPFAMARKAQFEHLVTNHGMAHVLTLARKHLKLDVADVRQQDLSATAIKSSVSGLTDDQVNSRRATLTESAIRNMLDGTEPHNFVQHPVTKLNVAGTSVLLDHDVLALSSKGQLHVVQIKSFPEIDGQIAREHLPATEKEAAVFVLGLRQVASYLNFDESQISSEVLLITPRNTVLTPTARVVDVSRSVGRLSRMLEEIPSARDLDDEAYGLALPSLPDDSDVDATKQARRDALGVLLQLQPTFAESCNSCPLFAFCRDGARDEGLVSTLGGAASGACGSVQFIDSALKLAHGTDQPRGPAEEVVALGLSRAAMALAAVGQSGAA